ncbi:MAG: DNA internalization-related competence protein ComEC/Rec2 [Candidatus Binatia bacterium]
MTGLTDKELTESRPGLLENRPEAFLIIPTLSLLAGQALVSVEARLTPAAPILIVACLAIFLLAVKPWRWALLFVLSATTLFVGYFLHQRLLDPKFPPNHLRSINNAKEPLYVEAVHYREPERLPDRSRWYLEADRIWFPNGAQEVEGRVLVTVETDRAEWHYGDRVRLGLRIRPPHSLGNPGSFDYESYLARRGIYLTARLETDFGVELLSRETAGFWWQVEYVRRSIGRFFERHLISTHAALLKALVVGDMGGITRELREQSAAAGVAHILSISGLHVGMLGVVIFFLVRLGGSFSPTLMLRWNLLKIATFFSFLAVLLYTCLAGAMVPTVRSAVMIAVYEFAVLLDREEEVFGSLALAALLIGLAWPGVVMDISFQLSFLAVLFIVWGTRKSQQWWPAQKLPEHPQERGWLRAKARRFGFYLAVPILATLGTGPMIAHHFGHLSLAGFVSNPVLVPLVGFTVVPVGLLVGFLSLGFPGLAELLLGLAKPLLWLTETLISFFASVPAASINVPIPNLVEVGFIYALLVAFLFIRRRGQFVLALTGALFCVAAWTCYWWQERWNRDELRITHLSVGQGDAAVVEFPGAKVLLIDAGGTGSDEFNPGEAIVAPFLRSRKIRKVDYLLLAHPRVDHYGGMKPLVEQFSPTEFWSGAGRVNSERYQDLESALQKANVKRQTAGGRRACQIIEKVEFCVVYASQQPTGEPTLIVRLTYRKASFFFAGDIATRDEKLLLAGDRDGLRSVVLKVPRHGSASSSTEAFISAVKPRLAVFSVGHGNPFGLPREEVVSRYQEMGAEILRTDLDGAIILETHGRTLKYQAHRSGKRGSVLLDAPP